MRLAMASCIRNPQEPAHVSGLPIVGNALQMAKDPGRFFYDCYRKYGPVFRLKVMSNVYTVLAGTEAATFMGTREGRDSLRSKEFWQGLVDEWGAKRTLTGEDGETHQKLRAVMKHGYSKESMRGRYNELIEITDSVVARDCTSASRCQWCRTRASSPSSSAPCSRAPRRASTLPTSAPPSFTSSTSS
jgi:cytochrome P450